MNRQGWRNDFESEWASPEKVDERGGGTPTHIFSDFQFLQNLYLIRVGVVLLQYKSKETPQLIGLFSLNLVITNFMQCFLYGPIG